MTKKGLVLLSLFAGACTPTMDAGDAAAESDSAILEASGPETSSEANDCTSRGGACVPHNLGMFTCPAGTRWTGDPPLMSPCGTARGARLCCLPVPPDASVGDP